MGAEDFLKIRIQGLAGIGGLGNIMELLKHAGKLRGQMEELKNVVVEGSAGGGMVRVRFSGKFELIDCKIEPHLLADKDAEMLEDLIVAAHADARRKAEGVLQEKMKEVTGGLPLPPGLGLT